MSNIAENGDKSTKCDGPLEEEAKWFGKTPDGEFTWNLQGVYYEGADSDGGPERVCSPLVIESYSRDQDGSNWGMNVLLRDPDDKEHRVFVPSAALSGNGNQVCALLLSRGLRMGHGRTSKARLFDYLQRPCPQRRETTVNQVGWSASAFVLPDQAFGCTTDERLVYQPDSQVEHHFASQGTLGDWQQRVGILAVGNSRLEFCMSIGVAAPMLQLLDIEGGGFNLLGASSTGKSSALIAAGSVCGGGGKHGYGHAWRSTNNALEATAFAHNDCLLVLDELGQIDPRDAGDCAYLLSNGSAKTRMNRTLDVPAPRRWRLLVLSAGEVSLGDQVEAAGGRRRAGHEVRLVDVPADAGLGLGLFESLHDRPDAGTLADDLRKNAKTYYGSPLRAFLDRLVAKPDLAEKFAASFVDSFLDDELPSDASGEVRRVAKLFALVGAAGDLAIAWRIFPWPVGAAGDAAETCFRAWLDQRRGSGGSDLERSVRSVRNFLLTDQSRFFDISGSSGTQMPPRCAGYRDGNMFYVIPAVFEGEATKGYDAKATAQELKRRRYLLAESGRLKRKTPRLPDGTRPRAYAIRKAFLEADEE